MCVYVYIYIYIYRERERKRCVCIYMFEYIYIYIRTQYTDSYIKPHYDKLCCAVSSYLITICSATEVAAGPRNACRAQTEKGWWWP